MMSTNAIFMTFSYSYDLLINILFSNYEFLYHEYDLPKRDFFKKKKPTMNGRNELQ